MNPFSGLARLAEYLDPVIAIEIMMECGAETIEVGETIFLGTYRPEGKVIRLSATADFGRIAVRLSPRFGFPLTKRDAALLTLLHEAKHCLEGEAIATMDPTERERRADEFAVKRFLELRGRR